MIYSCAFSAVKNKYPLKVLEGMNKIGKRGPNETSFQWQKDKFYGIGEGTKYLPSSHEYFPFELAYPEIMPLPLLQRVAMM